MENKKYKCIKSHTGNEVGEIYDENYKPKWFKNFGSVSEFVKATPRWTDWFVEIAPVIQQTRDMQSEFKVGDYVFAIGNIREYEKPTIGQVIKFNDGDGYNSRVDFNCNNNKKCIIWSNIIRHATPEEINNHLVSIGQIPAGEPLNTGIEPNKDGMFRFNSTTGTWTGLTPTNHLGAMYRGDIMDKPVKPKMILSIDDEELPMVSIIKTNTIKQLLNND